MCLQVGWIQRAWLRGAAVHFGRRRVSGLQRVGRLRDPVTAAHCDCKSHVTQIQALVDNKPVPTALQMENNESSPRAAFSFLFVFKGLLI